MNVLVGSYPGTAVITDASLEREVPPWTQDDAKVREFILHRFPHAFDRIYLRPGVRSGRTRRHPVYKKAAELAAVIYYWFRLLLPAAIAEELGLAEGHVIQRANDVREHGNKFFSPGSCDCNARRGRKALATRLESLRPIPSRK